MSSTMPPGAYHQDAQNGYEEAPVAIYLNNTDAWVLVEAAYRGADRFDDMYDDMVNDGVLDDMSDDEVAIARDAGKKIRNIAHDTIRQLMAQRKGGINEG